MQNINVEDLFSLRIFSVDHYVATPIAGLDACYSEYRGSAIKQVPIIRAFGMKADGTKVCMHIHGVFPYLYIPFSQSGQSNDANKLTYQIANSLDKAINISLGQSNSTTQHVYKVVLVKAMPFYGYHPNEHQFLKIYLFNPQLIKRAANLFQNGTILNQIFQPHETHVPFILQFFIDYNLYGMSFLHVPSEAVQYRQRNNDKIDDIDLKQILPERIQRISTSKLEIDVPAAFILNRLQISSSASSGGNEHANPGIAFLWNDERMRRSKMDGDAPNVELPVTQEERNATPTESDQFYRQILLRKLDIMNETQSELINETVNLSENRNNTLNLKQSLLNTVYPAECTQHECQELLSASFIEDHLKSKRPNIIQNKERNIINFDESIVDEALIMNLSQRVSLDDSLNPDEIALLEAMRELESNENVDDDSILAPLTQMENEILKKLSQKSMVSKMSIDGDVTLTKQNLLDSDSDDDMLNDFSITLEAEAIQKTTVNLENDHLIPQMDGMNDTPKRAAGLNAAMPKRLPIPLDIQINKSPRKESSFAKIVASIKNKPEISLEVLSTPSTTKKMDKVLSPPIETTSMIDLTFDSTDEDDYVGKNGGNVDKNDNDFDEIPSSQTNQTGSPVKLSLRKKIAEKQNSKTKEKNQIKENGILNSVSIDKKYLNSVVLIKNLKIPEDPKNRKSPRKSYALRSKRKLPPAQPQSDFNIPSSKKRSRPPKGFTLDEWEWSTNDVAKEYDRKNDFYPEAGPSNYNFYERTIIPAFLVTPVKNDKNDCQEKLLCETLPSQMRENNSLINSPNTDDELNAKSFYDTSMMTCNTPSPLNLRSSQVDLDRTISRTPINNIQFCMPSTAVVNKLNSKFSTTSSNKNYVAIKPTNLPPTFNNVLGSMSVFNIPDVVHPTPFYSDTNDLTDKQEVGQTVLHIPANDDIEEFESTVSDGGLKAWRQKCFVELTNQDLTGIGMQTICEILASEKQIIVSPHVKPPSTNLAIEWLRQNMDTQSDVIDISEDNSVQRQHEKPKSNGKNENLCDIRLRITSRASKSLQNETKSTKTSNQLRPSQSISNGSISQSVTVRRRYNKSKLCLKPIFDKTPQTDKPPSKLNSQKSIADEIVCLDDSDDDSNNPGDCDTIDSSQLSNGQLSNVTEVTKEQIRANSKKENGIHLAKQKMMEGNLFGNNFNLDGSTNESRYSFGITGVSLENTYGFKMDLDNFHNAKANLEYSYLTILSLEIHAETRGNLNPDPAYDPISSIFYSIQCDAPDNHEDQPTTGVIFIDAKGKDNPNLSIYKVEFINIHFTKVYNEKELLIELLRLIAHWDPDIYCGYEIEMNSWGYVIQRGNAIELNLPPLLSRVPTCQTKMHNDDEVEFETDEPGNRICGRIYLDVWRLMRSEIALTSYTFENIMYHILHRRYPVYSFRDLTRLWKKPITQWIVLQYYIKRTQGTLELLSQLDIIGRTSELAKLFGIQFYEVLSRGSQFRVESMMLRIAKPRNIVPVSPSIQQRAHMKAPEYLPLILEPHSRMYTDPLIVLDFQSLYPSMMMAYNYCFSTCLGKVQHLGQSSPFEFGASQLRVSPKLLQKMLDRDLVTISPCGAVFVKSSVREGILPRMVREILDCRQMVKQSMKLHKNDKLLQRILHSRQLGLKLMANVTYGYTAANFSGRMPCVEVGDSVVSKGRETLERAIKLVNTNKSWACNVVYGDTDSLFVLAPGRTREDAFRIGNEIVEAITADNPFPVKLKLEKIYQPSILQTKKRYVGFMYESPDQQAPVYEAKGIETVRRDGCPAVAKILQKTLKILFETYDVSAVKKYICRQFTKILTGRINAQDLMFAKEFRGLNGYKPTACVPPLELTRKWMQVDRRAVPRRGERVPYIVVNGPPGLPLIRLVRSPHEYLNDEGLKINSLYYITKVIIPPLNRCLLLIGANAAQWYADLPKKIQTIPMKSAIQLSNHNRQAAAKKSTISQYFSSTMCATDCGEQTQTGICTDCLCKPAQSAIILSSKIATLDRKYSLIMKLCQSCCGQQSMTNCKSLDCPILFVRNVCQRDHKQIDYLCELLVDNFSSV